MIANLEHFALYQHAAFEMMWRIFIESVISMFSDKKLIIQDTCLQTLLRALNNRYNACLKSMNCIGKYEKE